METLTRPFSFNHLRTNHIIPLIVGGLAVIIAAMVAWFMMSEQIVTDLEEQNVAVLERVKRASQQQDAVFDALSTYRDPECSEALLAEMRRLLYFNDTVADIEFMPSGNPIATCSATVGVYPHPKAYPTPMESGARRHRDVWPSAPVLFNSSLSGYLVKEGRFAVVINIKTAAAGLDISSFEIYSGSKSHYIGHFVGEKGLFSRAEKLAQVWYGNNLYATSCSDPDISAACVVSVAVFDRILLHLGTTTALSVLFSLAVGYGTYRLSRRWQHKRASPAGRIVRSVKKKQNFFCLYQPIVDMQSGQIVGCEVLARFQDGIGPLYPDEFIPIIEKADLTWPFTQHIITQALIALQPLCKERPHFKVSVNFYPKDLQKRYLERISNDKALQQAASNDYALNCEILETGIGEAEDITPVIAFLHQQGFTVAIDDFGTGFSNLSQLSLIDAEYLKIDKSFIQGLDRQEASVRSSLVPHILEIAKIVQVEVIAEGIETNEHLQVLLSLGVRYGQGFLFSRPIPQEDLVSLAQQGLELGLFDMAEKRQKKRGAKFC